MRPDYLKRTEKPALAYHYTPGNDALPPVMFCGGYRSDMNGTKATYLEAQCKRRGQGYVRFDYSGHGLSEGRFEDGTISLWAKDAQAVLDHCIADKVLLVGSSMGGWISLLLAQARPEKIAGLIGIAAAPDFTQDMYERRLNAAQRAQLQDTGAVEIPNDYSDTPYYFTRAFYEDGQAARVLNQNLDLPFPMTLVQGRQDVDVPWQTAETIKAKVRARRAEIIYIEEGDHRLSRPQDLAIIDRQIEILSGA